MGTACACTWPFAEMLMVHASYCETSSIAMPPMLSLLVVHKIFNLIAIRRQLLSCIRALHRHANVSLARSCRLVAHGLYCSCFIFISRKQRIGPGLPVRASGHRRRIRRAADSMCLDTMRGYLRPTDAAQHAMLSAFCLLFFTKPAKSKAAAGR